MKNIIITFLLITFSISVKAQDIDFITRNGVVKSMKRFDSTRMDTIFQRIKGASKGLIIGNSTITAYLGYTEVGVYVFTTADTAAGSTYFNQAVPGHTISDQLTVYRADGNKSTYDWIIVEIGLNDLSISNSAATTLGAYQRLIDTIRLYSKAGAKILVSAMTPCRQRLDTLYGGTNGPLSYQKWIDMNYAIMGGGSNKITGVDYRINDHVAKLSDGDGRLLWYYEGPGDHIHENNAGRQVIGLTWRKALNDLGFLRSQQTSTVVESEIQLRVTQSGSGTLPSIASLAARQFSGSSSNYPTLLISPGSSPSDVQALVQISDKYATGTTFKDAGLVLSTNRSQLTANSQQLYINHTSSLTRFATTKAFVTSTTANPIEFAAGNVTNMRLSPLGGRTYFGGTASATAYIHIAPSTSSASGGQIKFAPGVKPTTAEDGALNYDTTGSVKNLIFDVGTTHFILAKSLTGTATLDYPSISAGAISTLTITVTGAAVGDPVSVGVDNASMAAGIMFGQPYVSSVNTVTLPAYNTTASSVDPASGTFRASVIKY